jgi:V-type H+-transporting ATPase subunit a
MIELCKQYFKKEKMIYNNLNKCVLQSHFLDGEVWILKKSFNQVVNILKSLSKDDQSRVSAQIIDLHDSEIPKPTYLPTNEFLWPFQEIVNTYGIPRYREINPTFFNIVTFPFLFGVMFGDIGHGAILLLLACYLCARSDQIKNKDSMLKPLIKVRYLLLMMGFFAFYCGFLYNDFLSVPLPIFGGSCYTDDIKTHQSIKDPDCVYPFGVDPKWYSASNQLSFMNSLKMKLSVIFGVTHMIWGILLKGSNEIYFGNGVNFIFEFFPQLIFMTLLFGYMISMIFIKWWTDWSQLSHSPPSLITQLMNIFLKYGSVVRTIILLLVR